MSGQEAPADRSFDEKEMAVYAESDDFSYMSLRVQPPSIWQRLRWWFASLLARLFGNPNASWISDVLFYGLLILVLGIAVWYAVRLRYGAGTSRSAQVAGIGAISSSNQSVDFDVLIDQALEAKDFKLAIRYLYLRSLVKLSEKGLVKLKDWKSPYDYSRELTGNLAGHYGDLSRLFEYVWYGDYQATRKEYEQGQDLVQQMKLDEKR